MFGVIGYMPTYLQMVTGVDATQAGLLMVPMMGSLLVASVVSGQVVSRTGRYKMFPIAGAPILAVGLALLSTLQVDSATWLMCTYLGIVGPSLGLALQILILVVQNSFPVTIVGTATASINYFRQVGVTVGSAIVGSIFASRLTSLITERLAALGTGGGTIGSGLNSFTPATVNSLPDAIRTPIVESYNEALLRSSSTWCRSH